MKDAQRWQQKLHMYFVWCHEKNWSYCIIPNTCSENYKHVQSIIGLVLEVDYGMLIWMGLDCAFIDYRLCIVEC